jgi:hypothetical protein
MPEAFFGHPENEWINERIWGQDRRPPVVTERIHEMTDYLKSTLYEFIRLYDLRILVLENVLTIPMHMPLGLAVAQLMAETHMPSIAHHHDFYWERTRFSVSAVNDLLDMAFPSRDHDLQHVVINQDAQEELAHRKGVSSIWSPTWWTSNTRPRRGRIRPTTCAANWAWPRTDIMILQPTRVVPRKGIEHAIQLVRALGNPAYKLVSATRRATKGFEYRNMLAELRPPVRRGPALRRHPRGRGPPDQPRRPQGLHPVGPLPAGRPSSPTPASTKGSATPCSRPSISRCPCW